MIIMLWQHKTIINNEDRNFTILNVNNYGAELQCCALYRNCIRWDMMQK